MGLSYTEVCQLMRTYRDGAECAAVLTIGRQNLCLHASELAALAEEFGSDLTSLATPFGVYADDFLRAALGAKRVDAMDASDYEHASIIHDLNTPVPTELHARYDLVVDGGSLEHIFNLPVALANVMRMVTVGGRVLLSNPANNLCGHGFFQFSPELAFRVFNDRYGFACERVALVEARFPSVELTSRRVVLDVEDPDLLARRVLRMSARPSMLMVQARKLRHLDDPFAQAPQQSDYAERWEGAQPHSWSAGRIDRLPPGLKRALLGVREIIRASRFNRRAYTRAR